MAESPSNYTGSSSRSLGMFVHIQEHENIVCKIKLVNMDFVYPVAIRREHGVSKNCKTLQGRRVAFFISGF
jgi:hypothetical protein